MPDYFKYNPQQTTLANATNVGYISTRTSKPGSTISSGYYAERPNNSVTGGRVYYLKDEATFPGVQSWGSRGWEDNATKSKAISRASIKYETRNPGRGEWIVMRSGSVEIDRVFIETVVSKADSYALPLFSTLLSANTQPKRDSVSLTQGNIIKSSDSNKPISCFGNNDNAIVAPWAHRGYKYGYRSNRYGNTTAYFFSKEACTVNYYEAAAGGNVTKPGTPTATISLSAGVVTTYTNSTENCTQWYESDHKFIMSTVEGNGGDEAVLCPSDYIVYAGQGSNQEPYYGNQSGGNTGITEGNYYVYNTTFSDLVWASHSGDGAGGDAEQHLGFCYLSNEYAWCAVLGDYTIVAPFNPTTIYVQAWYNNQWNLFQTHTSTGGPTLPTTFEVDGDFDGSFNRGGGAAHFVDPSGNEISKFKWSGTKPFFLRINDTAHDEEPLRGWCGSGTYAEEFFNSGSLLYDSIVIKSREEWHTS